LRLLPLISEHPVYLFPYLKPYTGLHYDFVTYTLTILATRASFCATVLLRQFARIQGILFHNSESTACCYCIRKVLQQAAHSTAVCFAEKFELKAPKTYV
jgi:hypothetical protein